MPAYQIPLGNHGRHVGYVVQCQKQRRTGEILFIAADHIPQS